MNTTINHKFDATLTPSVVVSASPIVIHTPPIVIHAFPNVTPAQAGVQALNFLSQQIM